MIAQAIAAAGIFTTGTLYYLDPKNGNDQNDGLTPATAVQTLGQGYALLGQGRNDVLVLMSDGTTASTARLSAGFTWAKNAAHLVGVCAPSLFSQRARIAPTSGVAAFANFFTVTANACLFANVEFFHGFNAGIAAEICLTLSAGARNVFKNCHIAGMGDATGATDAGSRNILIKSGSQENYFQGCTIGIDTVIRTLANASVEIQGGGPRNVFDSCIFQFYSSDGLQYALLGNAAAALDRFVLFRNCQFINAINSGSTAIAQLFKLVATVGGVAILDPASMWVGVTAVGDATTKAQTYFGGGTATNGTKGIVAT
ncbi:MAG TPA: hypothetical protein VHX11_08955 [Acidobacteriaceae bacterium]|nr:hypothetical protein [Acidobacteriaceae bacterium]